jgi:nucleoporin SEH1
MDRKDQQNTKITQLDVHEHDLIQRRLDSVSRRLARPAFLRDTGITCSRLPSQAASDSSLSPGELPHHLLIQPSAGVARRNITASLTAQPFAKSPLYQALDDKDLDEPPEDRFLSIEVAVLQSDFKHEVGTVKPGDFDRLGRNFGRAWLSFARLLAQTDTKLSVCARQAIMAVERSGHSYTTFDHGHSDLVLAVDFNFYGDRMVTASSDHRLKVWDKRDDNWVLLDSWRAHDAEVVDVKWNGPFTGSFIGSVGEDGLFKLWEEDKLEPPCSARRFKRLFTIKSETKIPFCSLDFKNVHLETYAALITRDGYLSLYEPLDHDNLAGDWTPMHQQYVCSTPSPQVETGFRATWHKEKLPCWTAIEAGLDRKSLSLAVAAMDIVKIFRTDKDRKWFVSAELTGAKQVIRDVAWANGSMRGYDLLATASKDGFVRIYEVSTPYDLTSAAAAAAAVESSPGLNAAAGNETFSPMVGTTQGRGIQRSTTATAQSGIGAGLAARSSQQSGNTQQLSEKTTANLAPGRIKQTVKKVAEIAAHGGSVWRVAFSQTGKLFYSRTL